MNAIADALVYAVTYINCRDSNEDEDHDVDALESIAAFLGSATHAEQEALAAAAERALAEEQSAAQPRPEFVDDYASWMEDVIGEGWEGNRRVAEG